MNIDAEYMETLRNEFVDECKDRLESITTNLENIINNIGDISYNLLVIRRDIHSIKGMGSSFGYPAVTTITHRAEEFLIGCQEFNVQDSADLYKYIDYIQELIKTEKQPSSEEIAKIVRNLPSRFNVDEVLQGSKVVETLSIIPTGVQQRLINDELRNCGFRTSSIASSIEAIEIVMHTRPDLILVSTVIDEISGIEMINILRSIKSIKAIPVILMTSFSEKKLSVQDLPPNIAIARKGDNFVEDLSQCLIELDIM